MVFDVGRARDVSRFVLAGGRASGGDLGDEGEGLLGLMVEEVVGEPNVGGRAPVIEHLGANSSLSRLEITTAKCGT